MVIFLKTWVKFIWALSTSHPHGKPFLCFGDKPVTKRKLYQASGQSCSTELHKRLMGTAVWLAVFCLTQS